MEKSSTLKLVLAGLFIAIGLALPVAFHAMSLSGSIFLPMHIPVLLCGLICGWRYGLVTGIAIPLLSSVLTGMPPVYPVALAMAFELAAYGTVIGLVSKKLNVFAALIIAMLSGRAVLGIANVALLGLSGKSYAWSAFIAGAFVTALPGIIIQLILVPVIFAILQKNKHLERVM
ncbi:MAG: ECF transporter S component [Lutispora sp.]